MSNDERWTMMEAQRPKPILPDNYNGWFRRHFKWAKFYDQEVANGLEDDSVTPSEYYYNASQLEEQLRKILHRVLYEPTR